MEMWSFCRKVEFLDKTRFCCKTWINKNTINCSKTWDKGAIAIEMNCDSDITSNVIAISH